jgi:hypothetical protein
LAAALFGLVARDDDAGVAAFPDPRPLAVELRPLVLLRLGITPPYG